MKSFFFPTLHSAGSCPLSCLYPNTSSKARCQCHQGLGAPRLPGSGASLPGTAAGWRLWEMGWPQDSTLEMLQKFIECKKFQSLNPGICQLKFVTSANFKHNLFVWKLCLRHQFSHQEGERQWMQDHKSCSESHWQKWEWSCAFNLQKLP